jgi:hypothetical protein
MPDDASLKECGICRCNAVLITASFTCTHGDLFCARCLQQHIEAEVNSKGTLEVSCPDCRCLLEYNDVQRLASRDTFATYDRLLLRRKLQSLPDFRFCKAADCGAGQEHATGDDQPIMTCAACHTKSCYTHDVPWHDELTCAQFDLKQANEEAEANRAFFQSKTKPCPECNVKIEKNDGCDHMTCRRGVGGCGHEFCWRCLAAYLPILREGNHHHNITCTYYAPWNDPDRARDEE